MKNRKALLDALIELESNRATYQFFGDLRGWKLIVNGVVTAELTNLEKDYILRHEQSFEPGQTVNVEEFKKKTYEELILAVRRLVSTPSIPRNLDAATAEIVMGWAHQEGFSCGCLRFQANDGADYFVANSPGIVCSVHSSWSPTTNMADTQSLAGYHQIPDVS